MQNENDIMEVSKLLPEDFDGTFRFTNWTDADFIGKWGKKEYRFPAQTTSPIVMNDQTPLEVQQIRKKFAKDLAEQEFFRSQKYGNLLSSERNPDGTSRANSIHMGSTYSMDTLAPFIQKCLEPLPVAKAIVSDAPVFPIEEMLTRNADGELNTEAIDKKMSLKKKALEA